MEKLCAGVYRVRLGQPERHTPMLYKEYAMKEIGCDAPSPFSECDVLWNTTGRGMTVSLPLDTQVFGFGLQLKGFNHTRLRRAMRNNADAASDSGDSHAPVPFYVTPAGYGVFVDTARDAVFYCGQAKNKGDSRGTEAVSLANQLITPEQYQSYTERDTTRMVIDIPVAKGVDIYIFAANGALEAVQKYNMFSGGGVILKNVPGSDTAEVSMMGSSSVV